MLHSYGLRLLVVMVALPVLALLAVGFAVGRNNEKDVGDFLRARFEQRVAASAGGPIPEPGSQGEVRHFVLTVPVTEQGQIEPLAATESFTQFDPVPVSGASIEIPAGAPDRFAVFADPAFIPALDAGRSSTIGSLNRYLEVSVALAALAAAAAAWMLSRSVVRPVESLTAAVRRMERGDLSQRVDVRSKDEIGELAHAFNAMAQSIEDNTALRQRMASDVAHELRTPLNNIGGYLDAISDGVITPDPPTIALLQQETELLVRLVRDVEQLSQADAGELVLHREQVDMREIASTAVNVASPRATEADVTLHVDLPEEPAVVDGDAARLGQVLRNLLDNALTHTPPGGSITVRVRADSETARIEVEDSGPGIAEADLPHIFDRFYRADASRTRRTGGAGLGLAIVRQIVAAHGGAASAENRQDGGARMVVSLAPSASQ